MRVLCVGNADPYAVTGGYERLFRAAVEALRASGDEVRVLTPPALGWYQRDGGWWRPSRRERRAIEARNRELLAAAPCDVVVWWGMGGLPLWLLEAVDAPAVGVVGDGWMVYGPRDADPWSQVDIAGAAHWVFISDFALRRVRAEGIDPRSCEVVHPGVDLDRFPFSPPGAWRWRLACVGRVAPGKGVEVARAAAARLAPASLVVDGPGGDVHTPFERVHEAYAAADAILFCVEWPEPFGLVPLEAMAVGRPVVATGTGGSAEYLVDGENCLLVPPGDADAVAGAVERLAGDDSLRAHLIEGGRATAGRLTQAAFVTTLLDRVREKGQTLFSHG